VKSNGDSFPILKFGKRLVSALVVRYGLLESILAVKDIATLLSKLAIRRVFAELREDLTRSLGAAKALSYSPSKD